MHNVVKVATWDGLMATFLGPQFVLARPTEDIPLLLYRGQADATWRLRTTLQRRFATSNASVLPDVYQGMLRMFKREFAGLGIDTPTFDTESEIEWELFARHHGLPSPILDWTRSPFIAAYFAFAAPPATATEVSIYYLAVGHDDKGHGYEILAPERSLQFNPRAIEQRAIPVRVLTLDRALEDLLPGTLFQIDIPISQRLIALRQLDYMGINARTLFRDADRAAETAALRYDEMEAVQ
ncbi:MAG: FRG domain-containing protein [Phycisphaerae bacterium]